MEEKKLIKEMLYLGTGLTAQGLNKMKEMAEHFLENNAEARKQGEVVVSDLINRTKETSGDLREKVDIIALQLSEKSSMKKDELKEFMLKLMDKPVGIQEDATQKFHDISDNLAHHGNMKKQEALLWLEELKAEILENRDLAKSRVDEMTHKLSLDSKKINEKGKMFVQDIAEKSYEIKEELDHGLHNALDRFLSKISLSRTDRIKDLEKRVNSLESKN